MTDPSPLMRIDWRRELILFFTALTFLTRLPAPLWVPFKIEYLNESSRYFPIVGALVGLIAGLAYIGFSLLLGTLLAIVLSIVVSVLITGAFHEDGFADMCDGFGGGWEKMQVLTIMKDSRLGTYGALGLLLMVVTKIVALLTLTLLEGASGGVVSAGPSTLVVIALLVAHPLSRLFSVAYIYRLDYVQEDKQSKVKPLATQMSDRALIFAGSSIVILLLLLTPVAVLTLAITLVLVHIAFGRYLVHRIGGYTGDCLGAAQQISEVIIYLVLCATLA